MVILHSHIVPENVSNIRLSDYAIGLFPTIPSRKGLKKAIKKGAIYINGLKAETRSWVESRQKIDLVELDQKPVKVYPFDLEVIYEDDAIALINKPGGIVVSGNQFHTIQNALLHNLTPSTAADALKLPRPVHRLDHPTSGLLLIAKTTSARINLGRQFENKTIQKKYQAIVMGQVTTKKRFLNQPIAGKEATTHFELIQTVPSLKTGYLSLLNLYPLTGRTHQLRIHLANLGHPILGDKLYHKDKPLLKGKGLFLAAVALTFLHPVSGEKRNFSIPPPNKFSLRLAQEERRWNKKLNTSSSSTSNSIATSNDSLK